MNTEMIDITPEGLAEELSQAEFFDARLSKRLGRITKSVAVKPSQSFPKAMGNDAASEGLYRFLNHDGVTAEKILEPHLRRTAERMAGESLRLVVHDSSEFTFQTEALQQSLGPLSSGRRGFLGHFALGVTADGLRLPLGLMGMHTWVRRDRPPGEKKPPWSVRYKDPNKESRRWSKMVHAVEARRLSGASFLHLMDSEGDDYDLLADMYTSHFRFVVRLSSDRLLDAPAGDSPDAPQKLSDAFEGVATMMTREVPISPRRPGKKKKKPRAKKRHPVRRGRIAQLTVQTCRVSIKRPANVSKGLPSFLPLNIVRVFEECPPEGEAPIEWLLATTEPIETPKQVSAVIDFYCARWVIEEYFKALKTGCAFKQRRLESLSALLRALAIFVPVACQLLQLRSLTRLNPEAPASSILTAAQLALLRRVAKRRLSDAATVKEALWAIAGMGGHLKSNGPPGWLTLSRGYEELLLMERGWLAALQDPEQGDPASHDPPCAIHAGRGERCD